VLTDGVGREELEAALRYAFTRLTVEQQEEVTEILKQ
jgi:hypothetical protein